MGAAAKGCRRRKGNLFKLGQEANQRDGMQGGQFSTLCHETRKPPSLNSCILRLWGAWDQLWIQMFTQYIPIGVRSAVLSHYYCLLQGICIRGFKMVTIRIGVLTIVVSGRSGYSPLIAIGEMDLGRA